MADEQEKPSVADLLTDVKASIDDSIISIDDSLEKILEALDEGQPIDREDLAILRGEIAEAHGSLERLAEQLAALEARSHLKIV